MSQDKYVYEAKLKSPQPEMWSPQRLKCGARSLNSGCGLFISGCGLFISGCGHFGLVTAVRHGWASASYHVFTVTVKLVTPAHTSIW